MRLLLPQKPWKADLLMVAMLAIFGFLSGSSAINHYIDQGKKANFNQVHFSSTVMMACGHGFNDVNTSAVPGLQDFLARKTDTFNCAGIPEGVELKKPFQWQQFYFYLLSVIAIFWKLTSISWSGLWPVYGTMLAFTLVSLYSLFRLGIGQVLAGLGIILVALSLTWLNTFPHLYYFLKAPFIFAVLAVMGHLVLRPPERWNLWLGLTFLLGAILGVSLGFRRDLMVMVPLATFVILFCRVGNPFRHFKKTVSGLAAFAAGFVIAGWPLIETLSTGSNSGHIFMLGLSSTFTSQLGIEPSFYDWGQTYHDSYNRYLINVAAWINDNVTKALHISNHDYDVAGISYFLEIFRHFPGDFFLRFLASVKANVNLFEIRGYNFGLFSYAVTALAFLGLARRNLWAAGLTFVMLLYVAGYPSLLFRSSDRFFLSFIPVFAGGMIVQFLFTTLIENNFSLWNKPAHSLIFCLRESLILTSRNQIIFLVFALVSILAPLWGLRAYQTYHLDAFLRPYWTAERQELKVKSIHTENSMEIREYDFFHDPPIGVNEKRGMNIGFSYVVAEFDRKRCSKGTFDIEPRYDAKDPWHRFKRPMKVDLNKGEQRIRVFIPALWYLNNTRLGSIALPAERSKCLVSVGRITQPKTLPVLMFMSMPDTWDSEKLYMGLK
jgi:hypothetical protein